MSRIVRVTQNSTGNWWVDLHSRFPAMLVDSSSVDQWLAAGGLSRDDLAFDGRRSQTEFEERFGSRVESRSEVPRGVVSPTRQPDEPPLHEMSGPDSGLLLIEP